MTLRLAHQRAHLRFGMERIADADPVKAFRDAGDETIGNRLFHQKA